MFWNVLCIYNAILLPVSDLERQEEQIGIGLRTLFDAQIKTTSASVMLTLPQVYTDDRQNMYLLFKSYVTTGHSYFASKLWGQGRKLQRNLIYSTVKSCFYQKTEVKISYLLGLCSNFERSIHTHESHMITMYIISTVDRMTVQRIHNYILCNR